MQAQGILKPEHHTPEVDHFGYYLEAFKELHTCRTSGFGMSSIPFTAIYEYYKIFNDGQEDFEDFLYLIRMMDNKFIELDAAKNNKGK